MKFRSVLLLMTLVLLCANAQTLDAKDSKKGIVVWNLQANAGVQKQDLPLLSNYVANLVAKYANTRVISEADINTILKGEEARQQCSSDDTNCVVEIGAALGVPETVSGDVGKIGNFWMLNLRRINVHNAQVISRSSRSIEGTVNDLIRALPEVVAELFGVKPDSAPVAKKEAPTTGTLSLGSNPKDAAVTIDGKSAGKTPLKATLKVGKHKVVVTLKNYKTIEHQVIVKPGETTDMQIALKPVPKGQLRITSSPAGATLKLNGKKSGTTPAVQTLPEGTHHLELELEGYEDASQDAAVKANETTEVAVILQRDYPMNPYTKWGYVSFFSGVGLAAFGGVAAWQASSYGDKVSDGDIGAEDTSKAWEGAMWACFGIGGAAMVTGIVLWALAPEDKEWWENHNAAIGVTPDGNGATLSLGGRW